IFPYRNEFEQLEGDLQTPEIRPILKESDICAWEILNAESKKT
ncbi:conserved hypothetical protein, partial [Trichinella spiralis]